MLSLPWAVSQALSYSPAEWLAFLTVAGGTAYFGKWRGILAGQLAVAVLVCCSDVVYQSRHSAEMDMDAVFESGMLGRVLLINTVLLVVSLPAWLAASRRRKPAKITI